MVTYSRQFLDKVKQQVNLVDLVGKYTTLTKQSSCWSGLCPHPDHHDMNPSFRIWYENNSWSWACMSCHSGKKDVARKNYGSDCFAFVQWMSDYQGSKHVLTWPEAVKYILDMYHIPLEYDSESTQSNTIRKEMLLYESKVSGAKDYLYRRGLTDEDIKKWHIGFDGKRITFPIFNQSGQPVGFSKRKYLETDDSAKYLTSYNFQKSKYLYGWHDIAPNFPYVFITEGVFDVILARKYGVKNVVCGLGCTLSDAQIDLIAARSLISVICFDHDNAGLEGIKKTLNRFSDKNIYGRILLLPQGKDLADTALLYKEKLSEYIKSHMQTYWEYILTKPAESYQLQLREMQRKAMPIIMSAKQSVKTEAEQVLFAQYVRQAFQINL